MSDDQTQTVLYAETPDGLAVSTDAYDYAPGSIATFTATNVVSGGTVTFSVAHVDPGPDGFVGTADDGLSHDLTGTTAPWSVTDGGLGDLDGIANGAIVTSWAVNQDALDQAFQLTATDDGGATATAIFTDAQPNPSDNEDPTATQVNLTASGATATINDALFVSNAFDTVSGNGVFPTFVQVGDNDPYEQGYNYDRASGLTAQFDEKTDKTFNHKVLLSDITIVEQNGQLFYTFTLDSNEPNSETRLLSLDALQVYTSTNGSLTNFDQPTVQGGTGTGFGANADLVYDMDAGADGNVAVLIDSTAASGSGKPDLAVFIPVENFSDVVDPTSTYVYLYSAFGYQGGIYEANSGPEEWSTPVASDVGGVEAGINIVKVTGDGPDGTIIDGDGVTLPVGDPVTWTYTVTNTGNVPLSNVTVTDDHLGVTPAYQSGDDGDSLLETGETWVYTATGTAILGLYNNIGTATGHYLDLTVSDIDPSSYTGLASVIAGLSLSKDTLCAVDGDSVDGGVVLQGSSLAWVYTLTNSGEAGSEVTNIILTDDQIGTIYDAGGLHFGATLTGDDGDNVLQFGETWTFTVTGTAVPGDYENIASASGTDTGDENALAADSELNSYFGATTAISILKEVSADGATWFDANDPTGPVILVGEDAYFRVTVTNNTDGGLSLNGADVTDNTSLDFTFNGGDQTVDLAAGASIISDVVQTTAAAGQQEDTATVTGTVTDECENTATPTASDDANYYGATAAVAILKEVSCDGTTWFDANDPTGPVILVGGDVYFRVTVTNNTDGGLSLTAADVSDNTGLDFRFNGGGQTVDLPAGASIISDVIQTTAEAGQQEDTATVTGTVTDGINEATPTASDDANYFGATAAVSILKEVSADGATWFDANDPTGPVILVGGDVYFRVTVTNNTDGGLSLSGADVTDNTSLDFTFDGGSQTVDLLAGESRVSDIVQTTAAAGQQEDTASVSGTVTDDCENTATPSASDDANYFGANPAVSIAKNIICADDGTVLSADAAVNLLEDDDGLVQYQIVVANTGNVDLADPQVTDTLLTLGAPEQTGGAGDLTDNILDVGESWTYLVTAPWEKGGPNTNTAEVIASYTDSGEHTANLDETDSAIYFGLDPHISLTKLTNGEDGPDLLQGQAITWTYDVKNDGNVALTGVSVSDSPSQAISAILSGGYNSGDIDLDEVLDQGETWHYQATGTAGSTSYANTATATTDAVEDNCGDSVTPTATDGSSYTGHAQAPIGLTKGYWATHLTQWDVVTSDSGGTDLDPFPQYNWNGSGGNTASAVVSGGPASGRGAVSGANNGGGDSGLLLGDLNHNGQVDGGDGTSCYLFFDLASAQVLANSSVSGDARVILGSQAVAAQLNEYQDYVYDQANGGVAAGFTASPNGLIDAAVRWLKGDTTFALSANGKSKVNFSTANDLASPAVQAIINDAAGTDYTLSGGAITFKSTALSSSDNSWSKLVSTGFIYHSDVDNADHTVYADGEGLKNALAAYNHGLTGSTGGFVVSTDGSLLGWQDTAGGGVYDVQANNAGAFWGILENQNLLGHAIAGISDHA